MKPHGKPKLHEKPETSQYNRIFTKNRNFREIPIFLGKNGYIPRRCSSRFQSFPYWSEGVNTTIRRRGEVMRIRVRKMSDSFMSGAGYFSRSSFVCSFDELFCIIAPLTLSVCLCIMKKNSGVNVFYEKRYMYHYVAAWRFTVLCVC